jgi:hypothetical protein
MVAAPVPVPANNNNAGNNNRNNTNNGFNLEYHCRSLQSSYEALSEEIAYLQNAGNKGGNNINSRIAQKRERLMNIEAMIRRDCHSTSTRYVDGGKRNIKRRTTRRGVRK